MILTRFQAYYYIISDGFHSFNVVQFDPLLTFSDSGSIYILASLPLCGKTRKTGFKAGIGLKNVGGGLNDQGFGKKCFYSKKM